MELTILILLLPFLSFSYWESEVNGCLIGQRVQSVRWYWEQ